MAEEEHSGLSVFDGVLIVGGALIVLFVIFKLVGFVADLAWFVVKVGVVVAVIALAYRLLFHGRSKKD